MCYGENQDAQLEPSCDSLLEEWLGSTRRVCVLTELRQLAAGCDTTLGNGTFEWSANETEIDYNVDVNCVCIRSFWNCSAVGFID